MGSIGHLFGSNWIIKLRDGKGRGMIMGEMIWGSWNSRNRLAVTNVPGGDAVFRTFCGTGTARR